VNYRSIISRLNSEIDLHLFVFLFSLAVANTDLIRYFLAFEPKLRSLLHTIRLWIKQKDLLGKGHRFNTYTLFWMIVCTLQLHDKQLPRVSRIVSIQLKFMFFFSSSTTTWTMELFGSEYRSNRKTSLQYFYR
jgi:DNA polymerase sigma